MQRQNIEMDENGGQSQLWEEENDAKLASGIWRICSKSYRFDADFMQAIYE